jgi:energy-coupling factor transport system ATP-binding protein
MPQLTRRRKSPLYKEGKRDTCPLVNAKSVFFRFGKNSEDVLNNLSLNVYEGELLSIVGGNGAGKTTLLRLLSGIIRPYSGRVAYANPDLRLVYLPQNPQSMFAFETVLEDLLFVAGELGAGKRFLYSSGLSKVATENISPKLSAVIERLNIGNFLTRHPFDLSFGELQRAALAMILLKQPRVILLDEPTKGVDAHSKVGTAALLKSLCVDGVAVVAVTHDIEFAAEYSDRCAMLFDGRIIDAGAPEQFFSGNICYTTVAHRIAGSVFPHAVTCEEVINQWKDHATKQ